MNQLDNDIAWLDGLAKKYTKKRSFLTKKDLAIIISGLLLVAGMLTIQTINAFALIDKNAELEKKLAQYQVPVPPTLPAPYVARNVSLDFTQPFPEITVSYLDDRDQACKSTTLEVPPSIQNDVITDKWPGYF